MRRSARRLLAVLLLVAAAVPLIVCGAAAQNRTLKLVEPGEGAEVGGTVDVKGTGAAPSGEHVWVLVHRIAGYKEVWWPQGEAEPGGDAAQWSVPVTFGQPADVGYDFGIAVITVGEKEHSQLRQYLTKAMTTGDWRPIPMPPTTSAPIHRTVRKVSH